MMTMKSKGSLLVTLGILLTVGIASLIVSSESFAEEVVSDRLLQSLSASALM